MSYGAFTVIINDYENFAIVKEIRYIANIAINKTYLGNRNRL